VVRGVTPARSISIQHYNFNYRSTRPSNPESQARGERLPFADKSVDIITLENASNRRATISEIARVIKPGGDIRLVGPATPEILAAHQQIAEAVGGRVFQTIIKVRSDVDEVVYTNIIVPARK
jgi:ubiquinone/menaquinone biosynthesis C-methylase UbiE